MCLIFSCCFLSYSGLPFLVSLCTDSVHKRYWKPCNGANFSGKVCVVLQQTWIIAARISTTSRILFHLKLELDVVAETTSPADSAGKGITSSPSILSRVCVFYIMDSPMGSWCARSFLPPPPLNLFGCHLQGQGSLSEADLTPCCFVLLDVTKWKRKKEVWDCFQQWLYISHDSSFQPWNEFSTSVLLDSCPNPQTFHAAAPGKTTTTNFQLRSSITGTELEQVHR